MDTLLCGFSPSNYIWKVWFKANLSATIWLPYERIVWHFKHENSDHIKRAIDIFDWESALNYIDANDQVSVFNSTILNIISNFIPNETITCDDRDPPWMNSFIKVLKIISTRNLFVKAIICTITMLFKTYKTI